MAKGFSPGRTRAPGGSNVLDGTSGGESGLGRDTQAFPVSGTGRMGPVSTKNRRSRQISGPSYSTAKDLEYKGT